MEFVERTLSECALFRGLSTADLKEISSQAQISVRRYAKDEVVAFEEDPCTALGVLASGGIHIQRIFPSGKLITIETFGPGDSFGEALIFSDRSTYPATLVARESASVLYISKETIVSLCSRYPRFLETFIQTLSNRILLLNSRIKNLSFGSVRQKVVNYILEEHSRQKSDTITLTAKRSELADLLGIPRPSLSRELISLKEEGWIDFDRRTIQIHSKKDLEAALTQ